MESKIVERGGKFVVVEDQAGVEKEHGSFGTMAEAEAKEAELKLREQAPDLKGKDLKDAAKGSVDQAAAQQRESQALDRKERLDRDGGEGR